MCGVLFLCSRSTDSRTLHWMQPPFMLAFPASYQFVKQCFAALLFFPGRTAPTIAMNTCPELWSLRRLKRSLNKMQGLSEARLNTKSDVAITLMGCKLFCAAQRNLHQVNVQVLHLCVDEALEVRQIVNDYALYSIMFWCVF